MLTTLGDIVDVVYEMLQDVDQERYQKSSVYNALNEGLLEARRLRPDFWRAGNGSPPQYAQSDEDLELDFPEQYKPALVNYVTGRVLLRDREDSTDSRAAILLNTFTAKLTTIAA